MATEPLTHAEPRDSLADGPLPLLLLREIGRAARRVVIEHERRCELAARPAGRPTKRDGGRWTSLGRRLLVAWLADGHSARELAVACHVTPAAVSALACGVVYEPSLTLALAIESEANIAPKAWTMDRHLEASKTNTFDPGRAIQSSKTPRDAA